MKQQKMAFNDLFMNCNVYAKCKYKMKKQKVYTERLSKRYFKIVYT